MAVCHIDVLRRADRYETFTILQLSQSGFPVSNINARSIESTSLSASNGGGVGKCWEIRKINRSQSPEGSIKQFVNGS